MGGLGSGRRKDRGRKTVESYRTLDIDQLSKNGWLRPGLSSTCQWTDGNEVVSINFRAEAGRVHLSYPVRVGDREWRDVTDTLHRPSGLSVLRPSRLFGLPWTWRQH